jgi:hypothetical protein
MSKKERKGKPKSQNIENNIISEIEDISMKITLLETNDPQLGEIVPDFTGGSMLLNMVGLLFGEPLFSTRNANNQNARTLRVKGDRIYITKAPNPDYETTADFDPEKSAFYYVSDVTDCEIQDDGDTPVCVLRFNDGKAVAFSFKAPHLSKYQKIQSLITEIQMTSSFDSDDFEIVETIRIDADYYEQ